MDYVKKLISDTKIIKLEMLKNNVYFCTYSVTLKFRNTQMTFLYQESVGIDIDVLSILDYAVGKYNEINNKNSIESYLKMLNRLSSEDRKRAEADYKNSLKIHNGLNRLYGRDINKVIYYINGY